MEKQTNLKNVLSLALLLLALLPVKVTAQSTVKMLVMKVVRVSGNPLTAYLKADDSFTGPMWNLETGVMDMGTTTVRQSRIKEIRFEVQEVDAVDAPEASVEEESENAPVYDLQGRRIAKQDMRKGIYIIKGKKYVKR